MSGRKTCPTVSGKNVGAESTTGSHAGLGKEEEMKEDERQEYLKKYFPEFLSTVKMCVKETGLKRVDVGNLGLDPTQIKDVLDAISNSKVHEFSAENSDLRCGIRYLIQELKTNSTLSKLNLRKCKFRIMYLLTLMDALKETKITDLDLSYVSCPPFSSENTERQFVNFVCNTLDLTHLRLTSCSFLTPRAAKNLAEVLDGTNLTHLWLENTGFRCKGAFKALCNMLPELKMKELHLGQNEIEDDQLKPLCKSLQRCWELNVLDLHSNKITENGMSLLSKSLDSRSGISLLLELILTDNKGFSANNISMHIRKSKITVLHLGGNQIHNCEAFSLPDLFKGASVTELHLGHCNLGDDVTQNIVKSLKSSKVTKINLSSNRVGLATISEFANCLKETQITEIDFSENQLSAEALDVLVEGIKDSKLRRLTLRGSAETLQEGSRIANFVEKIGSPGLESLDISYTNFENSIAILANALKKSEILDLNLSSCQLGGRVDVLAKVLKDTTIIDLNLTGNNIDDDGAIRLGESIIESIVAKLNLGNNLISDNGAMVLGRTLQRGPLYELNLEHNKITDSGLELVADLLKGTYVTDVNVAFNTGCKVLPLATVLWRNRTRAHKLYEMYHTLFDEKEFEKEEYKDTSVLSAVIEKILVFYKLIMKDPSAISCLAKVERKITFQEAVRSTQEEEFLSMTYSKGTLTFLVHAALLNYFQPPYNLDVTHCMDFLDLAIRLELDPSANFFATRIAERIIMNKEELAQPEVYEMLKQIEEPLCNLKLGPDNMKKIMKYFKRS
ncbi:unnamed protein product [Bemisia tabaci]|uniref:Uncharacterized protein n=1 Tax=Bemisia tabaci TaxID=7038 RepID=A0A9P0AL60_BEMTA|nr:unnamed protein product [Bemisia tabaci]